jgi:hypothetical protein
MARILRRQTMSMKGEPVDFGALAARNADQITLGNTKTNVRGDILGNNGTVLKTQEQVEAEWARKRALQQSASRPTDIKAEVPPRVKAAPPPADIDFPTVEDLKVSGVIPTTIPTSKRKMVDSDE